MNLSKDNKYERYEVAQSWNLTPKGPKELTRFILIENVIKTVKMLYGELMDGNADILALPRHWGFDNREIIKKWFQEDKLNEAHRVELGLLEPNFLQIEDNEEDKQNVSHNNNLGGSDSAEAGFDTNGHEISEK